MLEYEADFAFAHMFVGNILAVEQNLSAVGVFQPGDDAQQGGFTATGRTQQGDKFSGGYIEVDVLKGMVAAEVFVQIADGDAHGEVLSAAANLRFCR